jgi:hypothetical protein
MYCDAAVQGLMTVGAAYGLDILSTRMAGAREFLRGERQGRSDDLHSGWIWRRMSRRRREAVAADKLMCTSMIRRMPG